MDEIKLRETVINALCAVAPEADPASLEDDVDIREQLDIDSVDYLNYVIRVHEDLKVEIPEAEYRTFATIKGAVMWLKGRVG